MNGSYKQYFTGKTVLVMGLGSFGGGVDSAEFACKTGAEKVIVTDKADANKLKGAVEALKDFDQVEFRLGRHYPEDFAERCDVVIVNPAVALDNDYVVTAKNAGKVITSQMQIFLELRKGIVVAVTGANGKSTTCALTAHLLSHAVKHGDVKFSNVRLSGNIGNVPLLGLLDEIGENDITVLEISSFQIEQLGSTPGPEVAVITNLTENHLDRHGTFGSYCDAKKKLFTLQRKCRRDKFISIFNSEDEITSSWFESLKDEPGRECFLFGGDDVPKSMAEKFKLPGRANLSNLAAALTVCKSLNIGMEMVEKGIESFRGLEHRLEFVCETKDVRWYNDSISTTPESTIAAVESFNQPLILIAGGYDKGLDLDKMADAIAKNARALVVIGQTGGKIAESVKQLSGDIIIETSQSMNDAVDKAARIATKGDVVVLSPGCASYDMFDNFQHRARVFKERVLSL